MVSIIILSYNTADFLMQCLGSIIKHMKGISYEIIVVDNASSDDSVEMVKKHFPEAVIIQNAKNEGFAKGVNEGAKKAKGEYLLLLNSDTELVDATCIAMLDFAKKNPEIAVIGGRLQNLDNSSSKSFGKFYTLKGVYEMLFRERSNPHEGYKEPTDVDWVSGGYMLIQTAVFKTLLGLDEHFFMYLEDMEFCYRVKKDGHRVVYFPDSSILHVGQGSSNREFAVVSIYKGLQYFYKKHKTLMEYSILKLMLVTKAAVAIITGVLTKNHYLTTTYRKALLVTL